MLSLNRAQIIGNVTQEPEMRFTPNGQAVSNFSVATNRKWKNQDGTEGEQAEYHNIIVWGKQAETLTPMIGKGMRIFVEGRLQTRSWETDGVKRYKTEIVADNIILLDRKTDTKAANAPANEQRNEEIDIEEIPF